MVLAPRKIGSPKPVPLSTVMVVSYRPKLIYNQIFVLIQLPPLALSNGAANLIPCDAPEENWWCGKNEICQTGDGSSFGPWPSGISKNIASVHDSKISTTASPSQLSSVTSPNSTTRSNISSGTTPASTLASITSTTVDEKIHEKSPSPISIGLGVGLSLGIALLGLLGLHVSKIRRWRALKATMQQRSVESRPPELEANDTGSDRRHHEIDGHIGVPEMAAQREVQRYEL